MSNRKAVTLRFKDKDLKIMSQIISKEFGPGTSLEAGLKHTIINVMQAYINNLKEVSKDGNAAQTESSGDTPTESSVSNTDSPVLSDSDSVPS